jgi:hypothetical protein
VGTTDAAITTDFFCAEYHTEAEQPLCDRCPKKDKKVKNEKQDTTAKFGLEVSLNRQTKDGGESAKSLLKKYGIAYPPRVFLWRWSVFLPLLCIGWTLRRCIRIVGKSGN